MNREPLSHLNLELKSMEEPGVGQERMQGKPALLRKVQKKARLGLQKVKRTFIRGRKSLRFFSCPLW